MSISTLIKSLFLPLTLVATLSGISAVALAESDNTIADQPAEQVVANNAVNINTADAEQIASILSGIGTKKAQAIVEWRENHGDFVDIDQLIEIKGIGEKVLEKIRHQITL